MRDQDFVDSDNDFSYEIRDNCPGTFNPDQKDTDKDGKGDECDNCPSIHNIQGDIDKDGIGNECDSEPGGPLIPHQTDDTEEYGGDIPGEPPFRAPK
jgi:Thrombospondin type 3 repeat